MRFFFLAVSFLVPFAAVAAESYSSIQSRRPDLFDSETGYRIERQRAPTPHDIPGTARTVTATETANLLRQGAVAVDVFGALQSRYDELDGTWLVGNPRKSLPGAVWLPEVGRGVLDDVLQTYLATNLKRLTEGDKGRPIVVFCVADCWMSWNASQRIADLGYQDVNWFRLGTDGWLDEGRLLVPIEPVPVKVD